MAATPALSEVKKKFGPPGPKEKLKFWPEPGPTLNEIQNFGARQVFSDFDPERLVLSDFKTGLFNFLHLINVYIC